MHEGYDQTVRVTVPDNLASGEYFITPWSDSYDAVLEDTLATNINPQRFPTQFLMLHPLIQRIRHGDRHLLVAAAKKCARHVY